MIAAQIGPESSSDGLQPYMFQTGEGTLAAIAWMSLPPRHKLPEINIIPSIPGSVISRDNGRSWKRWTPVTARPPADTEE